MSNNKKYDAIIIGAGHNGLACASYLCKAGKSVLVLEERDIVGGFCTTEETVHGAPGFRFSPTSLDILTGNIPPSVIDELNLDKYGLKFISPDPFYSYVDKNGNSFAFYRDYKRTCKEIAKFSENDARAYEELTLVMRDFWYVAVPYLMGHPTRPGIKIILKLIYRALTRIKNIKKMPRLLLSSPYQILEEYFESKEVKAAMANLAVGGLCQLEDAGSGVIMSIMALQHEWGVRRPVGGQSAFVEALADCVRDYGGEIRFQSRVSELLVSGGEAVGVGLESGEKIYADNIVGAIDPWTLYNKICPSDLIPEQVKREFRGLGICRNNLAPARVDIALSKPVDFVIGKERANLLKQGTLLLADDIEEVRKAAIRNRGGELVSEIPLWLAVPSHLDKSLLPENLQDAEGIYVYLPIVPLELLENESWDNVKDKLLEDVIGLIERYAPGIRDNIIASVIRSPHDATQFSNTPNGHPFHVDMTVSQMGPWRPIPSLAGFNGPVPNLWHAGAGVFPMGTVCGWSGRSAAKEILRSN